MSGIPIALVPLVLLTCRRDIMGEFANHAATATVAGVGALLIVSLNAFLLYQTLFN